MTDTALIEMRGDFEVYRLPDGMEVFFRPSDHSYWSEIQQKAGRTTGVQSARMAGVSTVVSPLDWNPDSLMRWGSRMDHAGIATLAAEGLSLEEPDDMRAALSWLTTGERIGEALDISKLGWKDVRDDAARRGTNVHLHALHALAAGESVPAYAEMTDEERGYAQGITGWWLGAQPDVIATEYLVACPDLRVAGRPDLLCRLRDGRTALVDAKTGTFLAVKFVGQLAGYALLGERCGYERPDVGVILQVAADGSHNPVEIPLDDSVFLAALTTYRTAGEVQKTLRAARA